MKKLTDKQKLILKTRKKHPRYNTVQIAQDVGCSKQYVLLVLKAKIKDKIEFSTC